MHQTFNPKAPGNQGISFQGMPGLVIDQETPGNLTGPMVGKAAQDQDKRWTMGLLPANSVQGGSLVSDTMVLVNSQGHATPAQVTGIVGWTSNGNLRVTVKRLPLPDAVKAVRQAEQAAQKAQYKQTGPVTRQPQAAQPLPTLPGQAQPVTQAPAQAPADEVQQAADDQYAQFLIWKAHQAQQAQAAQAPATPALPTVPQPRQPRGKGKTAQ